MGHMDEKAAAVAATETDSRKNSRIAAIFYPQALAPLPLQAVRFAPSCGGALQAPFFVGVPFCGAAFACSRFLPCGLLAASPVWLRRVPWFFPSSPLSPVFSPLAVQLFLFSCCPQGLFLFILRSALPILKVLPVHFIGPTLETFSEMS